MNRRIGTRFAPVLGAVLALSLVAAACGGGSGSGGSGGPSESVAPAERVTLAGAARPIKVGVLRQPHLSHALFYEPYLPTNVSMQVVPFATSTEIKNAVVSGDLAFGVTGITSALQGAAAGEPVVVVASAADGGSAIIAKKDSGITKVTDLRGKKVGYVPGSAQDILLRLTLRGAGLDATRDVQLITVQFSDMAAALARGDIDAFSGAETSPSDALVRGAGTLVTHPYDTPMGKINIALITSQARIASDPALVQAMVQVHSKATDFMKANPARWAAKVVEQYGFPPESLDIAIRNIDLRWKMDDSYVAQAKVLGQQQLSLEQIKREPDYGAFINLSFVRALG